MFGTASILQPPCQLQSIRNRLTTQNLIIAFSVENAEVATYEVFSVVSSDAGDYATVRAGLDIQKQERETANMVWKLVGPVTRKSIKVLMLERTS